MRLMKKVSSFIPSAINLILVTSMGAKHNCSWCKFDTPFCGIIVLRKLELNINWMNINYYKIKMGIGQPVIITLQILHINFKCRGGINNYLFSKY